MSNGKGLVFKSVDDLPYYLNTETGWRRNGFRVLRDAEPVAHVYWGENLVGLYNHMQINLINGVKSAKLRHAWYERVEAMLHHPIKMQKPR